MQKKKGFTLVELVVVVLILGILAAVAAPKVLNTTDDARLNSSLQSLAVVRDAIDLYKADQGTLPAALATDLTPYLRGAFPAVKVGAKKDQSGVATTNTAVAIVVGDITATVADAWMFNVTTGELVINSTDAAGGKALWLY